MARSGTSSTPAARSRSAVSTGNESGTTARSTPSARTARTTISSSSSADDDIVRRSSSRPNSSGGWKTYSPTCSRIGSSLAGATRCRTPSRSRYRIGSITVVGTSCRSSAERTVSAKIRTSDMRLTLMLSPPPAAGSVSLAFGGGRRSRPCARALRRLRRGASDPDARRARTSSTSHLHLGNDIDGMVGDYDALRAGHGRLRDLARLHVLPRRARPPPRLQRGERPDARVRRALERPADPLRPARPERGADRGGRPLPRRGRARDQAPSAGAALRLGRRPARAGVRAGRGAARADPDPRRPRPAPDRGRPREARRARAPTPR